MKFSELTQQLGSSISSLTFYPTIDPDIVGVSGIKSPQPKTLSYVESKKFASTLITTSATALVLPLEEDMQVMASERGIAWIADAQPRKLFAQAIALFYKPHRLLPGIHPTAVIDATAEIGLDVAISANVVIQSGVKIGDGVCIYPNVVIYPEVQIGDRTVLHANCVIHERSQLGADCVIHSGAVIGAEGFGFVPTAEGWYKMEQSGITVLEDGVEIGCNSTVDRPAVGETRIGHHTKLDNMVHVGHGCHIGWGCALAAQVGLAGGVEVGNRVILAGQVGVANDAKIGDGAIASSKSGVHGTIDPGQVVSGYPAVDHKTYLKSSAVYSRLPQMHQSLKQLQHQLEQLQMQVQNLEAPQP